MSVTNRAKLIGKLHAALKKHYTPVDAGSRSLLDHILYASLLQDATYEMADEGIAKCEQDFYDWNEVRVTTVTELSQVFSHLPDPVKAATRLKGNLLEIFEEFFTFDIDHLKKDNLGKAVAKFEKMSQMTPFVLSYAVQQGLGGHSIPIDYAALVVMLSTGIVDQSEAAEGRVPGLERAIPKNQGIEFGSILHQCAVALLLDPKDKTARSVLDATDKGASDRFDEWLKGKEDAKKRVKKRKTSERNAARKAAEREPDEEVAPAKGKVAGKSKAAKPATPTKPKAATKPKSATKPVSKSKTAEAEPGPDETAVKTSPSKKASQKASKSASKKSSAPTKPKAASKSADATKPPAKSSSAKTTTSKSSSSKSSAAKSPSTKSPSTKSSTAKSTDAKAPKKAVEKSPAKPAKKTAKKSAAKADNRKLTKKKPR